MSSTTNHQPPKPGMRVVHLDVNPNNLRMQAALLRLLAPGWQQAVQQRATASLAAASPEAAAPPNPGPAA
jgi:hypothetical protein